MSGAFYCTFCDVDFHRPQTFGKHLQGCRGKYARSAGSDAGRAAAGPSQPVAPLERQARLAGPRPTDDDQRADPQAQPADDGDHQAGPAQPQPAIGAAPQALRADDDEQAGPQPADNDGRADSPPAADAEPEESQPADNAKPAGSHTAGDDLFDPPRGAAAAAATILQPARRPPQIEWKRAAFVEARAKLREAKQQQRRVVDNCAFLLRMLYMRKNPRLHPVRRWGREGLHWLEKALTMSETNFNLELKRHGILYGTVKEVTSRKHAFDEWKSYNEELGLDLQRRSIRYWSGVDGEVDRQGQGLLTLNAELVDLKKLLTFWAEHPLYYCRQSTGEPPTVVNVPGVGMRVLRGEVTSSQSYATPIDEPNRTKMAFTIFIDKYTEPNNTSKLAVYLSNPHIPLEEQVCCKDSNPGDSGFPSLGC